MTKKHTLEENAMKTTLKILSLTALLLAGSYSAFSQTTLLIRLPVLASQSPVGEDLIISIELNALETWISPEENPLLEDWMLVGFPLDISYAWDFLKEDSEAPLKLEDWMICQEPWCKKKLSDSASVL